VDEVQQAAFINVHIYTFTYINEHRDEKMNIKRSYYWKRKRTRKSGTRYKEVGAPISLGAIRLISEDFENPPETSENHPKIYKGWTGNGSKSKSSSINKANGELWNLMGYMRNRGIGKR